MGEKEDSAWVFDSLVGFLQGPIWSAPLLTFIEEKSLIFDSETEDSAEYRQVYQEYKNLVDLLLGCYMEDMGITPEQFEHACSLNKNTKMPIQFQQSLFEQIWAANEYDIFKRMMTQRNLELQLQALNLIEQKFGLTPSSLICDSDSLHDELVMEELLHKDYSLDHNDHQTDDDHDAKDFQEDSEDSMRREHERLTTQYKLERELLEKALRESANSSSDSSPEPEVEGRKIEEESVTVEPLHSINNSLELKKKFGVLEPIPRIGNKQGEKKIKEEEEEEEEDDDYDEAAAGSVAQKKSFHPPAGARMGENSKEANEEEIKRRQTYLKTQRDKLVSMKKEARSKKLKTTITSASRPGSARVVAEASMLGKQQDLDQTSHFKLEPAKNIQVRKALAARLKAEVVHNQ